MSRTTWLAVGTVLVVLNMAMVLVFVQSADSHAPPATPPGDVSLLRAAIVDLQEERAAADEAVARMRDELQAREQDLQELRRERERKEQEERDASVRAAGVEAAEEERRSQEARRGAGGGGEGEEYGQLIPPPAYCVGCGGGHKRKLVLVLGIEGSGTKMMTGILDSQPRSMSIPQPYPPEPPSAAMHFSGATWMQMGPYVEELTQSSAFLARTLVRLARENPGARDFVFHRSIPDYDEFHFPDILDEELWRVADSVGFEVRIVAMYRQPPASTMSAVRRNFFHLRNLRQMRDSFAQPASVPFLDQPPTDAELKQRDDIANVRYSSREVARHLTYLSRALQGTDQSAWRVVGYESFVGNPDIWLPMLADFLDMEVPGLKRVTSVKPAFSWEKDASERQVAYLREYFTDEKAKHQWPLLHEMRLTPEPQMERLELLPPRGLTASPSLFASVFGRFQTPPHCGEWQAAYAHLHSAILAGTTAPRYISVYAGDDAEVHQVVATVSSALFLGVLHRRAVVLEESVKERLGGQWLEAAQVDWDQEAPSRLQVEELAASSDLTALADVPVWRVGEDLPIKKVTERQKFLQTALPMELLDASSFSFRDGCAFHFLFSPSLLLSRALKGYASTVEAQCPRDSCLRVAGGVAGSLTAAQDMCAGDVATRVGLAAAMALPLPPTSPLDSNAARAALRWLVLQQADLLMGEEASVAEAAACGFNIALYSEQCQLAASTRDITLMSRITPFNHVTSDFLW